MPSEQSKIISHQILVNRFGAKLGRDALPILKQLQRDIIARLLIDGDNITTKRQLRAIQADIKEAVSTSLGAYNATVTDELSDFLSDELAFNAAIVATGAEVTPLLPKQKTVLRDVLNRPMVLNGQSVLLSDAEKHLTAGTIQKINGYISAGFYEGQPSRQIAANVRNAIRTAKTNADAVARTATNYLSNEARQATYKANSDYLQGYVISATLDSRTSDICKGFDGKQVKYSDSYQPQPPFHYNCRTTTLPWFVNEAPPIDQDYYQWLEKQPKAVQVEALGAGKAEAFRKSGLTPEEFRKASRNRLNQPISLEKMRAKSKKIDAVFE
jgi:SPP1 gp7 family putative phage head morphogenesis protein